MPYISRLKSVGFTALFHNMGKVIVSLTSYGVRLKSVQYTIGSILKGSVLPDKIVLWVAEGDKAICPTDRIKKLSSIVDVRFCKDLKSYKKIVPAVKEFPDDCIVTADDDLIYWKDWLKELVEAHKQYPTSIIAQRCRRISYENYSEWRLVKLFSISIRNFLTSGGGTLFPPKSLDKDVTNEELFMKYAPTADDIWINAMAKKIGTQIVCLGHPDLKESAGDKGRALAKINYENGKNDVYIQRIRDDYKLLGTEKATIKDFTAVYVLVSSEKDYYLEQLMMSIYSLKKFNDIKVKVLVDDTTMKGLVNGRERLKDMAEVIEIPMPADKKFSPVERSRYIKTNVRNLIDGDMMFIDTDTLIVDNIDMVSELKGDIYMCAENGQTKLAHCIYATLEGKLKCKNHRLYHNSGVIYCKDNERTRDLYKKWYETWLYTKQLLKSHRDQEPLAKVNDDLNIIERLPDEYNKMVYFTRNINGGRIVHYFATNHQFGKNLFAEIKRNKYKITEADFKKFEMDFYKFEIKKASSLCANRHSIGAAFYLY